jgi:heme exporter protein D
MMSTGASPIDSFDDASVVFTFGGYSFGVWLFFILAVLLFIGFFYRMIQHENRAYKAVIEHRPVEKGPAAEGEPTVY